MATEEIQLDSVLADGLGVSGEDSVVRELPASRSSAADSTSTFEIAPAPGPFDRLGESAGEVPPALARLLDGTREAAEGGAFRVLAGLTVVPEGVAEAETSPELGASSLSSAEPGAQSPDPFSALSSGLYRALGLSAEGTAIHLQVHQGAAEVGETVSRALAEQAAGLSATVADWAGASVSEPFRVFLPRV